jgi:hypothetical protein
MIMVCPCRITLIALLSLSLTSKIVATQAFELPPPSVVTPTTPLSPLYLYKGDQQQLQQNQQQYEQQPRQQRQQQSRFFSSGFHLRTSITTPLTRTTSSTTTWSLSSSSLDDIPRGGAAAAAASTEDDSVSGGTASIPTEVFNLVKSIAGAGVLSLPAGKLNFEWG